MNNDLTQVLDKNFFSVEERSVQPKKDRLLKIKKLLKNKKFKIGTGILLITMLTIVGSILLFFGGEGSSENSGYFMVTRLKGRVSFENESTNGFILVEDKFETVDAGSTIKTGTDGIALIVTKDNSLITLDANSQLKLDLSDGGLNLTQISGTSWYRLSDKEKQDLVTINDTEIKAENAKFGALQNEVTGLTLISKSGFITVSRCGSLEDVASGFLIQIVGESTNCKSHKIETPKSVLDANWYKKNGKIDDMLDNLESQDKSDITTFGNKIKGLITTDNELLFIIDSVFDASTLNLGTPEILISEPKDDFETKELKITVKGFIKNGGSKFSIDGKEYETLDGGQFEVVLDLDEGANSFEFKAVNSITKEEAKKVLVIKRMDETVTKPNGSVNLTGLSTDTGITLTWSLTNLESVSGFRVLRGISPNPGQSSDPIDDILVGANDRTYSFKIKDGETYHFSVCLFDGNTCNIYSNSISVKAPGVPTSYPN